MKSSLLYILAFAVSFLFLSGCDKSDSAVSPSTANSAGNGKAGSTARFSFSGNSLFTLSGNYLVSYDASNPRAGLGRNDSINTGSWSWSGAPETVFPYGNYVLLGTPSGMLIFENQGGQLQYVNTYSHMESCDPVVAQGDFAYVTLSTGRTRCSRGISQLEVINISDMNYPYQVSATPLNNPYGLAVNQSDLFICEEGKLCHLDVSDVNQPRILKRYDISGMDCIYDRGRLIVVGASGLIQYAIEGENLIQISKITAIRTP